MLQAKYTSDNLQITMLQVTYYKWQVTNYK
jgi:hypothetical protein